MLTTFCAVAVRPAIRSAGSPPGTTMKIRKTMKLTAISTRIIPTSLRMMNAPISAPPLVLHAHLCARVEGVAQAVAEDVEREDREHDPCARHERQPRRGAETVLTFRD